MDGNGAAKSGYLLFAWSPGGYTLHERQGEIPEVGAELTDEGRELVVTKIGASPYPADPRPCAYTSGRR
jgi:hypothetical protein